MDRLNQGLRCGSRHQITITADQDVWDFDDSKLNRAVMGRNYGTGTMGVCGRREVYNRIK